MGEHWLQGPLAGKAAAPGSLPWGHGVLCARPWVPWAAEFRGSSHLDWNPAAGEAAQGSCRNKLGKEDTPILHGVGRSGALGAQVFLFWFWPLGVPASSSGSPSCQAPPCPQQGPGLCFLGQTLAAWWNPFLVFEWRPQEKRKESGERPAGGPAMPQSSDQKPDQEQGTKSLFIRAGGTAASVAERQP